MAEPCSEQPATTFTPLDRVRPTPETILTTVAQKLKRPFIQNWVQPFGQRGFDEMEVETLRMEANKICDGVVSSIPNMKIETFGDFAVIVDKLEPEYGTSNTGKKLIEAWNEARPGFDYQNSRSRILVELLNSYFWDNSNIPFSLFLEKAMPVVDIGQRPRTKIPTREELIASYMERYGYTQLKETVKDQNQKLSVKDKLMKLIRAQKKQEAINETTANIPPEGKYTEEQIAELIDKMAKAFVDEDISIRYQKHIRSKLAYVGEMYKQNKAKQQDEQQYSHERDAFMNAVLSKKANQLDPLGYMVTKKIFRAARPSPNVILKTEGKYLHYTNVKVKISGKEEPIEVLRFYDISDIDKPIPSPIQGVVVTLEDSEEIRQILKETGLDILLFREEDQTTDTSNENDI